MFEDIIEKEAEPVYGKNLSESEFKILFCTICTIYKDCKFAAVSECIKEYEEKL